MADTRPRYLQIADSIAASAEAGQIAVGAKLPARKAIAAAEGVSLGTVERAVEVLASWGIAETRQGVGVFITSDTRRAVLSDRERIDRLEERLATVERRLGI